MIYALRDPRDQKIYYIGKSFNPEKRAQMKNYTNSNADLVFWFGELSSEGLTPIIEILEETSEENWKDKERWWINEGKRLGWPLINKRPGGAGASCGPREPLSKVERKRGIMLRLSDDEWAVLDALAAELGMPKSAALRQGIRLLDAEVRAFPSKPGTRRDG